MRICTYCAGILSSGIAMEMFKALNNTSVINEMWNNLVQWNGIQPNLTFMNTFASAYSCLTDYSCGNSWVYIGDQNINAYWSYELCSHGIITQGTSYWSTQYVIGVPPSVGYLKDINNKLTKAFQANFIQTYYNK